MVPKARRKLHRAGLGSATPDNGAALVLRAIESSPKACEVAGSQGMFASREYVPLKERTAMWGWKSFAEGSAAGQQVYRDYY
jgi:hypothetical protein